LDTQFSWLEFKMWFCYIHPRTDSSELIVIGLLNFSYGLFAYVFDKMLMKYNTYVQFSMIWI